MFNSLEGGEFSDLVILVPSKVASRSRFNFATRALASLCNALMQMPSVIVIHDSVSRSSWLPSFLQRYAPSARWDHAVEIAYRHENVTFIRRQNKSGSASALREAVAHSMNAGFKFGFIHLDDHVYGEEFYALLKNGLVEMRGNPNLLCLRYSGYPLICNAAPALKISNDDSLHFDVVTLRPYRRSEYTLWSSELTSDLVRGNYWPIAMWFCVFPLHVLLIILDDAIKAGCHHLAHVEVFYRDSNNFELLAKKFPNSSFGYINMQFGGIEMHRNKNWRTLLQLPNQPLL
jgi:hypothetical protein